MGRKTRKQPRHPATGARKAKQEEAELGEKLKILT